MMNSVNEAKLDLFLRYAKILANHAQLKLKIRQHFDGGGDYVLFRHSSLYFFCNGRVPSVQETRDQYLHHDYVRFDGERVIKIDPEYYLGDLGARRRSGSGGGKLSFSFEENLFDNDSLNDSDSGDNSNNNNNNNNNNGNNGNNG